MDNSQQNPNPTTPAQPEVKPQEPTPENAQPSEVQTAEQAPTPTATPQSETPSETVATTPAEPVVTPPTQATTPTPVTLEQASATTSTHKKPLLLIVGVFIIILLVAGGAVYLMGNMNKTQRLGAYKAPSTGATKTVVSPTQIPDVKEVDTIETGDPREDLFELEKELNTLN